ncbi:hypothetical protein AMTRI_Chr02g257810 [Amborella trichopoda]|uniref:uncharacterized protein LOC18448113 n=1 Tax=Amborella trichopoda TaxID=13333 RepID=UPI0005D41EC3|nr:uncharacterized protein LOC18448113 [Amborella trichopoda]|eukprot:XP_006858251.2 uncharacterized protein LOC18448113 [Amborella trichopoda]
MEGNGSKPGKPRTSISELFDSKDTNSQSGIFGVYRPSSHSSPSFPSSQVGGKDSHSEASMSWKKQGSEHSSGDSPYTRENSSRGHGSESRALPGKDQNPGRQDDHGERCVFSSSLYYGGRDVYAPSQNDHTSGAPKTYKKDGADDDPTMGGSSGASRGNWWQGSLYY